MKNIFIGADPEFFVTQEGNLVSAHGLISGTKEHPHIVKNGAVQVDGMALEINIDPAKTSNEFVKNTLSVLTQLKRMVPDYEFLIEAAVHFEEKYLKELPKEVTELGCDPDFNAYTLQQNPAPDSDQTLRTAAGHIHIGWTENVMEEDEYHFEMCIELVKQLDLFLGVPSLLFDNCDERRELYGKAGAFRPKSYGLEYRVLSNKWLQSEKLMNFVFQNARASIDCMITGKRWFKEITDGRHVINNNNRVRAFEICEQMSLPIRNL